MNSLNPIYLRMYKTEYENTPNLTIEDLCKKYKIDKEQLGDTSSWEKPEDIAADIEILPIVKSESTLPVTIEETDQDQDIQKQIREIKLLALNGVREFFETEDLDTVSTKEYRDMVAVLKDIEAGAPKEGPTNSINITIQQMIGKFDDDC